MTWFKRIFLFAAVNILIVVTLSVVLNLLGIQPYLTAKGINYTSLMAFCLVWGFGGAFISLFLSKVMAKWMMGVKIIDPQSASGEMQELVQTVHRMARAAGLSKMPEVGIYDAPDMNAFATGPTRSNSLVAVSTGLLRGMDRRSVEGVLAHEVAHIANGDMVTMTLVQGVMNAFVMFFARIFAFAVDSFFRRDEEGEGLGPIAHMMVVFVMEIIFGILAAIVVAWFSRWREYRADAGGARLGGRENMIAALRALQRRYEGDMQLADRMGSQPQSMKAFSISTRTRGGIVALFMSHPPLEERIQRLELARM